MLGFYSGGMMKLSLVAALLPFLVAFQEPGPPDFQAEVKSLRAEFQKKDQEYNKALRAAKTVEERKKLVNPAIEYLAKFQELADKAKGAEGGAAALVEVFQLAQRVPKKNDDQRKALSTLVADHIESPLMERLASMLRGAAYYIGEESSRTALKTIRDKAPVAKAKAAALFSLGTLDMEHRPAEARASFVRLKEEFAETPYASKTEPYLFEIDNLQVGKVAPEIEATDEKGVKFKLSDFRGKVTVIDFWGFW
jgi:hypothetical protein